MIKKIDELIRLVSKAWRVLNTNNRTSYKLTFKHFQNDADTKTRKNPRLRSFKIYILL